MAQQNLQTPPAPQQPQTDVVAPTQTLTANQGPVTDPAGIAAAGGTPNQAKMAGTPAQVNANAAQQQREQQQQQAAQQQQQQAEQQRLAGTTLQQTQRYEKPTETPTETQQRAMQIAETLNVLGPVKSRVQSLIQDQLQAAQTASASLQLNEQAIAAISDPAKRKEAEESLKAYMADPSQENLQKVYGAVGAEGTADLERFFATPEGSVQEAFAQAFQVSPTLESLDLSASGMDTSELAASLGIPESQLKGMTLDQLNQQIDAVEAAELNRTTQLQAQLQDPTLSPAMREAVVKELQQLGATGVIGAEQQVQQIQDMIDSANTVEIMGREMSVEELLSDEGLSSLVAQAATDPEMLKALKDDPQYAALAGWVEENQAAMAALSEGYEEKGEDFVEVQENYAKLKESLGKDGADLLKSMYGGDLADVATSGEFADIKAKLEATPLFRVLTSKGNEKYAAMLKEDPELAKQLMDSGFEDTEIEYAFDLKEKLDEGGYFATLVKDQAGEMPENGFLTSQDAMSKIRKSDMIERANEISPSVMAGAQEAQEAAKRAGLGDAPVMSLDDLETVNNADNPEGIMQDVSAAITGKKEFDDKYKVTNEDGEVVYDTGKIMEGLFGFSPVNYRDLQISLESKDLPKETKDTLLKVFDSDGDGNVSQQELEDQAAGDKLAAALGLDQSTSDIIEAGGDWEQKSSPQIGVEKGAWNRQLTADLDEMSGNLADSWDNSLSDKDKKYLKHDEKVEEYKSDYSNLFASTDFPAGNLSERIAKVESLGLNADDLRWTEQNMPPKLKLKADGTIDMAHINKSIEILKNLGSSTFWGLGSISKDEQALKDYARTILPKMLNFKYGTRDSKVDWDSWGGKVVVGTSKAPSSVMTPSSFNRNATEYNRVTADKNYVTNFSKNFKKLKTDDEKVTALIKLKESIKDVDKSKEVENYLIRYFGDTYKKQKAEKDKKRAKVSTFLKGQAASRARPKRPRGISGFLSRNKKGKK